MCLCETKYWPGGRVGITELMVSRFRWCYCVDVPVDCWQCLQQFTTLVPGTTLHVRPREVDSSFRFCEFSFSVVYFRCCLWSSCETTETVETVFIFLQLQSGFCCAALNFY